MKPKIIPTQIKLSLSLSQGGRRRGRARPGPRPGAARRGQGRGQAGARAAAARRAAIGGWGEGVTFISDLKSISNLDPLMFILDLSMKISVNCVSVYIYIRSYIIAKRIVVIDKIVDEEIGND